MSDYKDKLKNVIQGEMSALETYDQVIDKFNGRPEVEHLRTIRSDHSNAVNTLKGHYLEEADSAPGGSGIWGGIAKTVTGAAKVGGEESSLKALKQGEKRGEKEYNELLSCDGVPKDISSFIKEVALPNQKRHIEDINNYLGRTH